MPADCAGLGELPALVLAGERGGAGSPLTWSPVPLMSCRRGFVPIALPTHTGRSADRTPAPGAALVSWLELTLQPP